MKRIPADLPDLTRKRLFYGLLAVILACSALAFTTVGGGMVERLVFALTVGSAITGSALYSLGHKKPALGAALIALVVGVIG